MTRLHFLLLTLCLGLLAACLPGPGPKPAGQGGSPITGPVVTTTALPAPMPAAAPVAAKATPPKTRYGNGPMVPTVPGPLPMPKPAQPAIVAPPEPVPQTAPTVTTQPAKAPAGNAPPAKAPPAKSAAEQAAPPVTTTPEPTAPPAIVLDDPVALKCQSKGGQWANVGQSGLHACILPTGDGGKQCRAKTDCKGECLARSGTCSPIAPLFGCNEILTEGGLRVTQCID